MDIQDQSPAEKQKEKQDDSEDEPALYQKASERENQIDWQLHDL